jgi:hypothetical protein
VKPQTGSSGCCCSPPEKKFAKPGVSIYNESLERMEKMIEMGFKEGFTMTLNVLETLLASLSQH